MHDNKADGRGQPDSFGQARIGRARLIGGGQIPALAFPGQDDGGERRIAQPRRVPRFGDQIKPGGLG
jgi:hypothetical protein